MLQQILGSILRHGLGAAGVSAALISEDEIKQVCGALVALGMVAWSIWQKVQAAKKEENPLAQ